MKQENIAFLQSQVASGMFASTEEAIDHAVAFFRAEREDLSWAKPYIEEGLRELDAGTGIPSDEVFAELRQIANGEID